ncbi:MAG TPA: 3-hydroxybutyrate oligomer hydrolase family protein [Myxococcales bacterium]|nr:3-hydroxybutyrate oligomer hydrolase family protein [Myxococcales bacterium]
MQKRILALLLAIAACHASPDTNDLPSFVKGQILKATYDGNTDDLLTAGLGKTGLQSGTAPGFADPANSTPAELRRRAIYVNYRALVDPTPAGGYGVLYGPNVDPSGNDTLGEGKIAGDEWLAFDDDGTGARNATLMVQVPKSFDRNNPCIVTAASSGSRGVYGAIATAGEWGLKHGCAVAYTDKGSGMGVHDLQDDTVNQIDGTRATRSAAGSRSNFDAPVSDADRATFDANNPNRFAIKHAHSQQNPEKDWGMYTLHAVEFAYYVLNEKFGTPRSDGTIVRVFHPGQILTIAASVSNGAGAALAAAEQDTQHFISGVVAGEPQVQVGSTANIQRGGANVPASAKSLYDYTTLAVLYQGCAAGATGQPANTQFMTAGQIDNRCAALKAKGLINAAAQPDQSNEALARLQQAGWESESNFLHSSHFATYATPAVAVTYANAYSRASVTDNLCGYSFAFVDAGLAPAAVAGNVAATNALGVIFATGNGVPPMGAFGPSTGIQLIDNADATGAAPAPRQDSASLSATAKGAGLTGTDFNVDGAACLRSLFTGQDASGAALSGDLLARSNALKAGIQQVLRSGRLHGVPTILVQGRSDALVPVNHASRAYLGANKNAEGAGSPTVYYEVTNAQHFDAFIPLSPGLQTRLVPLHRYVIQSLDLMFAHLKTGAALPPSQVVRTVERGSPPAPITPDDVPPIRASPAPADQITFANGTLSIPN